MLWYARQAVPAPKVAGIASDPSPALDSTPATPPTAKKIEAATATARVGVVASRSAIGNAVQRARAKRRLREVFRSQQQSVPAGYDLLLVARSSLNRLEYQEIERRFFDACRKIFPPAQA